MLLSLIDARSKTLTKKQRRVRHIVGVLLGVGIMVLAVLWEYHPVLLPEWMIGVIAWTLHGLGSVPIICHIEPLWAILTGDDI